jgi:hypothetical protein
MSKRLPLVDESRTIIQRERMVLRGLALALG